MKKKRRILAVSFGTSFPEAREAAIGGIERALSDAFDGTFVQRCFTSGMVIRHIKRSEGFEIDDPHKALERALAEGTTDLLIQPTHIMKGEEYQKFMDILAEYEDRFDSVQVGEPLLSREEDLDEMAGVLQKMTCRLQEDQDVVVLVGHGSKTQADQVYSMLQKKLMEKGCRNVYVGTVESAPGVKEIREMLQADPMVQRVVLLPFMVVAGDHAVHDIAGGEQSWKYILEEAGYEVKAVLKGLGEYPEVQEMYVKHLQNAKGRTKK